MRKCTKSLKNGVDVKTHPHHGGRPKIISNPVCWPTVITASVVLWVCWSFCQRPKITEVGTNVDHFYNGQRTIGLMMRNKIGKPETTIYILCRYSYNFLVHNSHYSIAHNLYNMPCYLVHIFIKFVQNILNMISKNKNVRSIN